MVGLRVVRGRLPPWTTLGWPASRTKACIRLPSGTPVSPAMNTPPKNHPDDGAAEKRLPRPSATFTHVVSGDPTEGRAAEAVPAAAATRIVAAIRPISCDPAPGPNRQ